jgi:ferredoxin
MATIITEDCINCAACEPECPNTAIYQGGVEWEFNGAQHPAIDEDIFYIVPDKCTECVGFFDQEACAAVCPVDCCLPNPDIVETEEALLVRAKALHPEQTFGADFPSRFKGDGGDAAPVAAEAPAANGAAEPVASATPVAAPAPVAVPVAVAPVVAAPTPKPVAPKKVVEEKVFEGELAGTYAQALARVQPPQNNSILGVLLASAQPILGALPLSTKRALEQSVGDTRYFHVGTATGLNILFNMVLYPIILLAVYTVALGGELFSQATNKFIFLGLLIASVETLIRLRESFFQGVPTEETPLRGTFYGLPLAPAMAPFLGASGGRTPDKGDQPVEGYYTPEFDEKTERSRRYGERYTVEEQGNAYLLRMEFPRRVPVSAAKRELGIGDEMPDYEYSLALKDGTFLVRGSIREPDVRKIAAVSSSFPPDFNKRIDVSGAISSFKHRYSDKTLEVVLFKR